MITKLNRCPMVLKKLGSQTSVDDRYIRLSDAGIRGYKRFRPHLVSLTSLCGRNFFIAVGIPESATLHPWCGSLLCVLSWWLMSLCLFLRAGLSPFVWAYDLVLQICQRLICRNLEFLPRSRRQRPYCEVNSPFFRYASTNGCTYMVMLLLPRSFYTVFEFLPQSVCKSSDDSTVPFPWQEGHFSDVSISRSGRTR